jgi:dolichol-phosphate mannosyltransferase
MELSIVIPAFNEARNLAVLIDNIKEIFEITAYSHEIIVVDAGSTDNTLQIAKDKGANAFIQGRSGYGGALKEGINAAGGKFIITMDADLSHNPYIIKRLFSLRHSAHILIASRYVRGGLANMPVSRRILSRVLNRLLCSALSLPLKDISSGFRLYNAEIFEEIDFSERDFNSLVEILVKAHMNGFKVQEVPFHYQPRFQGRSHAKIIRFGIGFFKTFIKMWSLRNTTASADYDERAFDSRLAPQRFWQRSRYKIICGFSGHQRRVLDAGCGSSKILGALPQSIGLDINFKKLRYDLSLGNPLVNADIRNICFKDASFDEIICSQVIEHLQEEDSIFNELSRVLKKGGILILGAPDYSRASWILIEWLYKKMIPGGYADEHIAHYTRKGLVKRLEPLGLKLESYKYILGSELICKFIKVF